MTDVLSKWVNENSQNGARSDDQQILFKFSLLIAKNDAGFHFISCIHNHRKVQGYFSVVFRQKLFIIYHFVLRERN